MNGYSEIPTRARKEGVIDKLVLVETMADRYAHDREFAEFVLAKVAGAGSGADQQAKVWADYIESLPYRRERNEVLRDPKQTVGLGRSYGSRGVGGDCDDLTLAFLAGMKSLAIPCQAEILSNEDGWGFHIRAIVGFPPLNPKVWQVVDPVYRSEREWAMMGKNPFKNALSNHSLFLSPMTQDVMSGTVSKMSKSLTPIALATIAAGIFLYQRKRR